MNVEEKEINEKRKKIRNIVILVISLLCIIGFFAALSIWVEHNNLVKQQISEKEEYERKYLKRIERLGAILDMDNMNEEYLEYSWVKDRIILPDSDIAVSLYELNSRIYTYKILTGEDLDLTVEDIISLYQTPNEEKWEALDLFKNWYGRYTLECRTFDYGVMGASNLYEKQFGHGYKEKDFLYLTAEECAELAQWAIENPDYIYAQEDSKLAEWYANFLKLMGLSSEEDYPVDYLEKLRELDVLINMEKVSDADYTREQIKNRIVLPDTDVTVSLYELDSKIYAYNIITGADLNLTAEDIVSLYRIRNEEKEAELNKLYKWYCYNRGLEKYSVYHEGVKAASYIYESKYRHAYKEKEFDYLTAEECAELAKWVMENPDYDYIKENNGASGDKGIYSTSYARFLRLVRLISQTET